MTVSSLPKLGTPPAPAPLRKIALEEHFGHPSLFMRDSHGRFETHKEAIIGHLGPEYFEVVQKRLLDFDTTRLQAMDEAGVEMVLLSLTTFGIQAIADRVERRTPLALPTTFSPNKCARIRTVFRPRSSFWVIWANRYRSSPGASSTASISARTDDVRRSAWRIISQTTSGSPRAVTSAPRRFIARC